MYRPLAARAKRHIEAVSRGYDSESNGTYLQHPKQLTFLQLLKRLIDRIGPIGRGAQQGNKEIPVSGKPGWMASERQAARKDSGMWWWWNKSLDVCVRGPPSASSDHKSTSASKRLPRGIMAGTPTVLRWVLRAEVLAHVQRHRGVLLELFEAYVRLLLSL